jgi:hypothetical protein
VQQQGFQSTRNSALAMARVSLEKMQDVGFTTSIQKPLGVVFSDNEDPYLGLVVDSVEPEMNGAAAGIKVGDQLIAVNGEAVVGESFEFVMNFLRDSSGTLDLQFYRGTVRTLYTILDNLDAFQDEDDEEEVVMDENYETSVYVEVKEEKPLSAGDVFNALKNIGNALMEKDEETYNPSAEGAKEKKGLFGGMFSQETIQLEGDDATGLKRQPKNRN